MENNSPHPFLSVQINLSPDQIPSFFPLLQKGFRFQTWVGVSVQTFLTDHLGLTPEYIRDRVKTVFLDGKAADDLDQARILDGSRLALSGALPGLAGAVLRRGSPFAGLRSQIDDRKQGLSSEPVKGLIHLKIFNLLLPELGSLILRKGILISRQDFWEFWDAISEATWRGWEKARVNGKESEIDSLPPILQADSSPWILMEVQEKS